MVVTMFIELKSYKIIKKQTNVVRFSEQFL